MIAVDTGTSSLGVGFNRCFLLVLNILCAPSCRAVNEKTLLMHRNVNSAIWEEICRMFFGNKTKAYVI
jgi:hypothetical protein